MLRKKELIDDCFADFLAKIFEIYDITSVVFAWSNSDKSNMFADIIQNINKGV